MDQWIKRILPHKRRAPSPISHPDAPNPRHTTTATNVPSTSASRPLSVSPAQGSSSCVNPVQSNVIVNQPSTVPGPTGIDHNSPLLTGNRASSNPTSYTTRGALTPTSASSSFQGRENLPSDSPPVIANYTGAAARSPRSDVTASQTAPNELPSQVEETLAVCPRFRIVLVGNSGVGKSSLVRSVFNVSLPTSEDGTAIDVAHDRVGKADICREYCSDENPRFILHDSMGFEPGSTEKSAIVESFLRKRAEGKADLPEQVHAIWLCIETPRTGSRLLQTGDENLLNLAKELRIPVIVVFTKYDVLFNEHYRDCLHILSPTDRRAEAANRANRAFSEFTKELEFPFVPVQVLTRKDKQKISTRKDAQKQKEYEGATLVELTKVTRDNLRDVEGSLWALWATAQQIDARQKVEHSISEGLKKYWLDLGENVMFDGRRLVDCVARIRDDILKIWNFYDPLKVLSGEEFSKRMTELVEPLARVPDEFIQNQRVDDIAGLAADVVTVAAAISNGLIFPALGTTMALKFLHSKYQRGVLTAIYLAACIVDLILVLNEISKITVATLDPPKSLSKDLVMDVLATYKTRSSHIHAQVKEVAVTFKLEEKIGSVIRDAL